MNGDEFVINTDHTLLKCFTALTGGGGGLDRAGTGGELVGWELVGGTVVGALVGGGGGVGTASLLSAFISPSTYVPHETSVILHMLKMIRSRYPVGMHSRYQKL